LRTRSAHAARARSQGELTRTAGKCVSRPGPCSFNAHRYLQSLPIESSGVNRFGDLPHETSRFLDERMRKKLGRNVHPSGQLRQKRTRLLPAPSWFASGIQRSAAGDGAGGWVFGPLMARPYDSPLQGSAFAHGSAVECPRFFGLSNKEARAEMGCSVMKAPSVKPVRACRDPNTRSPPIIDSIKVSTSPRSPDDAAHPI